MTKLELLETAKPINFNTEMVKALLDGRKTVTRRIMKPQPWNDCHNDSPYKNEPPQFYDTGDNNWACKFCGAGIGMSGNSIYKSKYQTGDILYVHEDWIDYNYDEFGEYDDMQYYYKSDGLEVCDMDGEVRSWRSLATMPKEATRIFLKVINVRVERLHDITEKQARQEGFINNVMLSDGSSASKKFSVLWDSTVKKQDFDKYSWSVNPWVWVYEFERINTDDK